MSKFVSGKNEEFKCNHVSVGSLSKFWAIMKDREVCRAAVHAVAESAMTE
jgi:hypothetical protein